MSKDEILVYMQKEINVEGRSLICALERIAEHLSNRLEQQVMPKIAEENADVSVFEKELFELINKYATNIGKMQLLKKMNWAMGNLIVS